MAKARYAIDTMIQFVGDAGAQEHGTIDRILITRKGYEYGITNRDGFVAESEVTLGYRPIKTRQTRTRTPKTTVKKAATHTAERTLQS